MINELIDRLWSEAPSEAGYNPDIWRKDFAGAWIKRDQYGLSSKFGWVIDHIMPKSRGGDDSLSNLQALHWRNNQSKGDNYEQIETCITSEGNTNIYKVRRWQLNTQK